MTTMPDSPKPAAARRNVRLALVLAIVAVAFYVGFFIAVSNR